MNAFDRTLAKKILVSLCFSLLLISVGYGSNNNLSQLLPKVMPSVVNIATQGHRYYTTAKGKNMTQEHLASGVVIDAKQGLVVTNAHAVRDASTIIVTLNNRRHYIAELIGTDPVTDLAVLKIPAKHLHELPFATGHVKVGQNIIAIGNPFGLSQTVTSGIVSAIHRQIGIERLENFIQFDASINPGNSGGALINSAGELVGINTAILTPSKGNVGIGFAIPLSIVEPIVAQIIKYGDVKRGILGVIAQNLTPALQESLGLSSDKGAIITEVIPDSTAAQMGLKAFDVLVSINKFTITDAVEIRSQIGVSRLDSNISIAYLRDGKLHRTQGKLTLLSDKKSQKKAIERLLTEGMNLTAVDVLTVHNKRIKGIFVDSIEHGTHPWLSGLHMGDIITEVNRRTVTSLDQFVQVMKQQPQNKAILLNVLRNGRRYLIALD